MANSKITVKRAFALMLCAVMLMGIAMPAAAIDGGEITGGGRH